VQNWLGFFDLTLIGGFVIPSQEITCEGKASGALVDVHTGKIVFVASAQDNIHARAASFVVQQKSAQTTIDMRDHLVVGLANEFINKLERI
jgi:hypothetical protein